MDAGSGLPTLPLGRVQRVDDDVSAGTGIGFPPIACRNVGCLEAHYLRISWLALYRGIRPPVCPPVLAGLVRFPGEAGSLCGLLPKLNNCHRGPYALLHGTGQAVSRL